jgi:hypothetical protein
MRRQYLVSVLSVSCALAALVGVITMPAPGQTAAKAKAYKVPRTPWGDPDLQGVWPATDLINVPLQRPAQYADRLFLSDEEFQAKQTKQQQKQKQFDGPAPAPAKVSINPPGYWLDTPKGSKQTSLIVDPPDGKMPPLTEEALAKRAARAKIQARQKSSPNETYEDQSLYDRCISRGIMGSILPVIYNNGNEIIQTPGYVAIRNEMIHEARIIPLGNKPHAGPSIRSYMGDSRGHWDGDTLVVETTNFLGDKNGFVGNGGGDPHSADMVLTERFIRVSKDRIQYEATINDPKTFTKPWKVSYPLDHDPEYQLFEYACHEGNYSMFNMLSGARADEAAKGKQTK